MIILKKKRMVILLNLMILTFIVCGTCNMSFNNEKLSENTSQVVALPVTNKTVVIDARAWCAR